MAPQEQRIAIAQACGWTQCQPRASITDRPWLSGINPNPDKIVMVVPCDGSPPRAANESDYGFESLPDYLNDLNAMHKAEKSLDDAQFNNYRTKLSLVVGYRESPRYSTPGWRRRFVSATAAHRAEALLKTLSLWTP